MLHIEGIYLELGVEKDKIGQEYWPPAKIVS